MLYNEKLCEEISRAASPTIELRVLSDEQKNKCPHCRKPIETVFSVVEDSPNFKQYAKAVETL